MKTKWKTYFKYTGLVLLFALIVATLWATLHELIHLFAIKLFGFNGKLILFEFPPRVNFPSYLASSYQQFVIRVAPYILDLGVIIIHYFTLNKFTKWLSYFGLADILVNFATILAHPSNDFFVMIQLTNWSFLSLVLIPLALVLWYSANKEDLPVFYNYLTGKRQG